MLSIFDLILISHFTLFLAISYYYIYLHFKSEKKKVNMRVPDYIKEYLLSLGSDDFGDQVNINFGDKKTNIITFLSDNDIRNMSAINIHRYLLKLISTDSDYLMFKMDLPQELTFNITRKISDKEKMAEFVIKVKSFCVCKEEEEGKKQIVEIGDIMTSLMPMVMKSVIQDEPQIKEENDELMKEMNMILDE